MSAKNIMMAAAGNSAASALYSDDVFSTYLYTGNGSTQTITNGIDLAGKGGLVWLKCRTFSLGHFLYDTTRGATNKLSSNLTDAASVYSGLTSFSSSGFNLGSGLDTNVTAIPYASWTFRRAPKFFDVVTYTGTGVARTVAHSLGATPGCVIVKRTDTTGIWAVQHRSLGGTYVLQLEDTIAAYTNSAYWNNTNADASTFTVGTSANTNANGGTYVAYLFAHDMAADGIIQCGSFTTDSSGIAAQQNLGWEPQFLLAKTFGSVGNWVLVDTMRGLNANATEPALYANTSNAESAFNSFKINATGFSGQGLGANNAYIYLAIRRPNKPPTTGTQVFSPIVYTGTGASGNPQTTGFPVDWLLINQRSGNQNNTLSTTRLLGIAELYTSTTTAEYTSTGTVYPRLISSTGFYFTNGSSLDPTNGSGESIVSYAFRRAPGFFDVVCDIGTGAAHTVSHGLRAVPEILIRKGRSVGTQWEVYSAALANTEKLVLNSTAAKATDATAWNSTTPTASVFTVGTGANVNTSAAMYVTYLFASLPGISKVGTYTGNGTSQTINCGFTTGARFILIKRTDSTGDWYVWDTARGIVSANDPHLSLNTTAWEVTTDDSIDPNSSGFIVNQVSATNINVSGATYLYLAIA